MPLTTSQNLGNQSQNRDQQNFKQHLQQQSKLNHQRYHEHQRNLFNQHRQQRDNLNNQQNNRNCFINSAYNKCAKNCKQTKNTPNNYHYKDHQKVPCPTNSVCKKNKCGC